MRRTADAREAAIEQSARAVARREKTLEEHELYVEAVLAGSNVPPRAPRTRSSVALALGAVAATAVIAVVFSAALSAGDRRGSRSHGEARPAGASAERPSAPVVPRTAALGGALIAAREAWLDTTMVSRYQRSRKPGVEGGRCDPPKRGLYRCWIDEASVGWSWQSEWELTLNRESCWTALPVPPWDGHNPEERFAPDFRGGIQGTIMTQGSADAAPLRGCL